MPAPDRWGFLLTVAVVVFLSACHVYYLMCSRIPPSTDEAHYMSGALSIAEGIRSGTLSGAWNGYQTALGFKAPLICVPAALMMLLLGGVTLPCMLSLAVTFAALGFASYSLFRRCLWPFHAAIATALLLTMPMINGLTHRFYVELLLLLLCVVYLDVLAGQPWRSAQRSALAGAVLGLGTLTKATFPAVVALPALYSLWIALRGTRHGAGYARLLCNVVLSGIAALAVAASWYLRNWKAVLQHSKFAASAENCYYPHWILADISVGPWFVVFCAAVLGLAVIVFRLATHRETGPRHQAWILILLLGLTTVFLTAVTINKATRYTVTCLPALACLAVVAWRSVASIRWSRFGLIAMAALSLLLALHNAFAILPVGEIHIADLRIIGRYFPLNVPGWFNDNHPLDRRDFRLQEAEKIIAQDAAAHLPAGHIPEARTTTLGLLLNHDYFQLLSAVHKNSVHYTWWPGSQNSGSDAPDYIVDFEGFQHIYPGVHFFQYYPALREDVSAGRVPYQVLAHLTGPSQTGIWIYAKTRLESRGGPAAGDLVIEAENFHRGTVVADVGQYGYGIGVILTPRAPAWAEYDFQISVAGNYQIEFRYASAAARAVTVLLDGAGISKSAAASVTGGFLPENQRWEPVAMVPLSRGKHTLRLESQMVFPHIDRILLSPRP